MIEISDESETLKLLLYLIENMSLTRKKEKEKPFSPT